jgi:hypothetical protein
MGRMIEVYHKIMADEASVLRHAWDGARQEAWKRNTKYGKER